MKKTAFIGLICLGLSQILLSQTTPFRVQLLDSLSSEPVIGATIVTTDRSGGAITDADGRATLRTIADGLRTFQVTALGYQSSIFQLRFPRPDTAALTIRLVPADANLEEVVISTTRTNSRIDDLPQKIEVLGQGDMDEESTIVPGNISSILGDLAVITIQRTNPVNGNDAVRMQGLDAQYTQLLRDGLPLYSGFSGSLGVLSIPPLDLKQVEIVKGSSSTLYGGGAIAGLINFISKTPGAKPQHTLLLNQTTLNETNANAFFSQQKGRVGYTFFGGATWKKATDVNDDGFTEVPENRNFILHPRLFLTLSARSKLNLGLTSVFDRRNSGDLLAVRDGTTAQHPFLQTERTRRNTVDLAFDHDFSAKNSLRVKSAVGVFERQTTLPQFNFTAIQYSSYTEASEHIRLKNNDLLLGLNFISESFRPQNGDSTGLEKYDYRTFGLFVQDGWSITSKLMLEAGLRLDIRNPDRQFLLPRLALFYKPGTSWSLRLAAGTGYKAPDILALADPTARLLNNWTAVQAERSTGANADINFHTLLFNRIGLELNQAFYYTQIDDPLTLTTDNTGRTLLRTADYKVRSYGTDTYVRLTFENIELYLGYNHTEALQAFSDRTIPLPFNPKDKLSATLAYEIPDRWRMGIESSLSANQFIFNHQRVPNFWFLAAMVERKFKWGSLVLNCENLTDTRQSRHEPLVLGTVAAPVFQPVWGLVEGRVLNLSAKVNW